MYYKVHITETSRGKLTEDPTRFNDIIEKFKTLDEVRDYLKERYGKIPTRKQGNTIYRDPDKPVGFLRSYWNSDISHNSKAWYQTDWVEVTSVVETPILVN